MRRPTNRFKRPNKNGNELRAKTWYCAKKTNYGTPRDQKYTETQITPGETQIWW